MGSRGAGGHNDPVQTVFFDHLFHFILGILGTGEHILFHKGHMGKGPGIGRHLGHIDDAADIGAAVADKDPDPRVLAHDIGLGGIGPCPGQGSPGRGKTGSCITGGRAGFHDGHGNIFGFLEGAADIKSLAGGFHRGKAAGDHKIIGIQFDSHVPDNGGQIGRGFHAHGQDHHVKDFGDILSVFAHIGGDELMVLILGNGMDPGSDKPHPLILGPFIVFFKVLAVGSHVHEENGGFKLAGNMILGHHGFFYGIHAADRRAV